MIIDTETAANLLGVTGRRVRALIKSGQLPAESIGEGRRKTWLINKADLKLVAKGANGRRGKPKKKSK